MRIGACFTRQFPWPWRFLTGHAPDPWPLVPAPARTASTTEQLQVTTAVARRRRNHTCGGLWTWIRRSSGQQTSMGGCFGTWWVSAHPTLQPVMWHDCSFCTEIRRPISQACASSTLGLSGPGLRSCPHMFVCFSPYITAGHRSSALGTTTYRELSVSGGL